ncbi:MAG: hypothetical protein AB7F09_11685 [Parvibaculaceae bacterium]
MSGISSQEIRQLVREALRDLLPPAKERTGATGGTLLARLRTALADPKRASVEVRIDNAQDLGAFARDLLQAPEDVRVGILSGKIALSLARHSQGAAPVAPTPQRAPHQIAKGVVTEIMVTEIGKTSDRLIIGKGVVVTPLARDKAREVKLEIVRDRT